MPTASDRLTRESAHGTITTLSGLGIILAQLANHAANYTAIYKEPNIPSIDAIDKQFGNVNDIVDPLLTAHRTGKFLVIGAGDALHSACQLSSKGMSLMSPAILIRVFLEYASRANYILDNNIDWQERVLRTCDLATANLREFKDLEKSRTDKIINRWGTLKGRINKKFPNVKHKKPGNATNLIRNQLKNPSSYSFLSAAVHGNTVWLTNAVIQEQKQSTFLMGQQIDYLSSALEIQLQLIENLGKLWSLDLDLIFRKTMQSLQDPTLLEWNQLKTYTLKQIREAEIAISMVEIDFSEDPQPPR